MTIRYASGNVQSGLLVLQEECLIRVAVEQTEDFAEFRNVNGLWVAESGERVEFEFEWQRPKANAVPVESDCICSPELASMLVGLLHEGCDEKE